MEAMENKPLLTAHAGADGTPDNSLAFVRYALTLPVDAFEVDVRRNADGVLALGHDEAGADAPTLETVFALAAAHPTIKINCDLKPAGLERDVAQLAREAGLAGRLIFSGTVDAAVWASDGMLRDTAEVYLNIEEYVPNIYVSYREIPDFELTAAARIADVCRQYGIRTVNINQMLVTRRLIETLAQDGIGLSAWTVNDTNELRWFLGAGVRNITTREARRALELRAE